MEGQWWQPVLQNVITVTSHEHQDLANERQILQQLVQANSNENINATLRIIGLSLGDR